MRNKDLVKEELVKQKAIEIIVKYGLEGFTISKLAKACKISVGTPYVYYKDKDDLILKVVSEEGAKLEEAMNRDFDPHSYLEEGLRIQWRNRFTYHMENPLAAQFLEQISNSAYQQHFLDLFTSKPAKFLSQFKENTLLFIRNAIDRKEMDDLSFDLFWSLAFGPLYSLLRFHGQRLSLNGEPFELKEEMIWEAFERVLKALKTN